jgi:molybdenum cofactor biosynthesis enzyme MoaA
VNVSLAREGQRRRPRAQRRRADRVATFGRERGAQPRFIAFMPLDADGTRSMDRVVWRDEIVMAIGAVYPTSSRRSAP